MPHKQQPVSVAELHDIYGGERPTPGNGSTVAYRKTSFSVREADHPGSPPPRPEPDSKKRTR